MRGRSSTRGSAAFTILGSEYAGGDLEPVPATRTIESAGWEDFTVLYHPRRQGFHDAEIRITTDAGAEIITLAGLRNGSCGYTGP